jgi:hypothetical protein
MENITPNTRVIQDMNIPQQPRPGLPSTYSYKVDGEEVRVHVEVCKEKPICPDNQAPNRSVREGEVITIYPICGPGVFRFSKSKDFDECQQNKVLSKCRSILREAITAVKCK